MFESIVFNALKFFNHFLKLKVKFHLDITIFCKIIYIVEKYPGTKY